MSDEALFQISPGEFQAMCAEHARIKAEVAAEKEERRKMPEANPSVAADILQEAARIVDGERELYHGSKERSFTMVASLWSVYLQDKGAPSISTVDVAQMMVLLKIARSVCGEPVRDHFLDQAGYSAIAGELSDV